MTPFHNHQLSRLGIHHQNAIRFQIDCRRSNTALVRKSDRTNISKSTISLQARRLTFNLKTTLSSYPME